MGALREIPAGVQIAPSLLSADFAHLAHEIAAVERAGIEILHLDVMDGHFVPNITFGPPLVRSIRARTGLFLDAHLMISDPLAYLEPFARAGADLLTVHAEALGEAPTDTALARLNAVADRLRTNDCRMGLTFRPATDPGPWLERVGADLDLVLIMTVEPGFGGQTFMSEQLARIEETARLRSAHGWRYRIEVDGGVDPDTAGFCLRAGAEILVAGSAVFGRADRIAAIRALRGA